MRTTPLQPLAGDGRAGESARDSYAAARPAPDQRREGYDVKPLTEAVLYALAELRYGPTARDLPCSFRPRVGLWVDLQPSPWRPA